MGKSTKHNNLKAPHPKGPKKKKKSAMGTSHSKNQSNDDDDDLQGPPCYPVTETILGISEKALVNVLTAEERQERFVVHNNNNGGGYFVNEKTGTHISFGSFDTPTVEALAAQVAQLPIGDDAGNLKTPPSLTTRSGVDIGNLQGTLTTGDAAMVQVASNFNCLENGSRATRIDSGRFVDMAYKDCTQGPAAVFGTTSAYLYRCHFYKGGQSLKGDGGSGVNLLENTTQYFGWPQNGKLTLTGGETLLHNEEEIEAAAAKVCIGLHKDCPVLFGRSGKALTFNEPTQRKSKDSTVLEFPMVDHVLSASINAWDFGVDRHLTNQQAMTNLMRALLRAAYEGIYLAAILRRRKKLYLTLVGGGCFGNPIPLIVEEMTRAHHKWAGHPASLLEECVICLYCEEDERCVMAAMTQINAT